MDAELKRLITQAVDSGFDKAAWLVVADRLSEAGNPLGEYIVRVVQGGESSLRLQELTADWQARFVPWAQFVRWTMRQGIILVVEHAEMFLDHAEDLRELAMPLTLRRHNDACGFDAAFERFAWVTAQDNHHDVRIWRVTDETLLVDRRGMSGDLRHDHVLEFRPDGLYAVSDTRMYMDVRVWRF